MVKRNACLQSDRQTYLCHFPFPISHLLSFFLWFSVPASQANQPLSSSSSKLLSPLSCLKYATPNSLSSSSFATSHVAKLFSSSLLSCLRIWDQIHLGISPDWTSRSSISSKPTYLYEGSRSKVVAFINASQSREIVFTQNDSHARDWKELLPSETT